MKKAFTLIEVNLAMLIMAGGILSIVGLYSFGFRESRQSREDIAMTAIADSVVSPLVMAISATNMKWSVFRLKRNFPDEYGWRKYFNQSTGLVTDNPETEAENVFNQTMSWLSGGADSGSLKPEVKTTFPSEALGSLGMKCALVVQHEEDSAVVKISFRATRQANELLSMPLFYTEARFQGRPDL